MQAFLEYYFYFVITSRNYKISDQEKLYFVTFTIIHWIDLFVRNEYREVILESIRPEK